MKHVGTKTIETTRLLLRRLELTDAEMMFRNWTSDDEVTRFLRWDAHEIIDDTKNMIEQWVNSYQDDSTYYWGIYLKDGEMIGSIGITITSEYDFKGELGYKIGRRWWNQGYSSEAARAVIDYMFFTFITNHIFTVYILFFLLYIHHYLDTYKCLYRINYKNIYLR